MDSISYWYTPIEKDSIIFKVNYKSIIDTVTVKLRSKEIDSLIVSNAIGGNLSLRDTFAIATNIPIQKIDKSKISLIDKDSIKVNFTTSIDDSKQKLKLNFEKKYDNNYQFRFMPNAIEDLFGNVNDTINFSTRTKHPEDYGNINLTLTNVKNFPIIIHLTNKNYELVQEIYATENQIFKFNNLDPNDYTFRVIYDENRNGKWDSGNFLLRTNPEKVHYYNKVIEIRANWIENQTFNLK
jgi:hypothetical protein